MNTQSIRLTTIIACLLAAGCGQKDATLCEEHGATGEARYGNLALAGGKKLGVDYRVHEGRAVVEGDIDLGQASAIEPAVRPASAKSGEFSIKGIIIDKTGARWPNKTVYYLIDSKLPEQKRVTDAIAHWKANTEIKFELRTNQVDYVKFVPSTGCQSAVGRVGGEQEIKIGADCSKGNVIHEIGHAVGLWHEQSREDRETYVEIVKANIQKGKEDQFDQHISDGIDEGTYDFDSIMHYPANAFAKEPTNPKKPTIITKPAGTTIGQRVKLSAGDIAAVKKMYP